MENLLRSLRYQPDEGYGLCVRHQDPVIEKGGRDSALKGYVQVLIGIKDCAIQTARGPDHKRDRARVTSVRSNPDTHHPVNRVYNNGFHALLIAGAARSSSCPW